MSTPNDAASLHSSEPSPANTADLGVALCDVCEPEKSVLDRRDDGKVYFEKRCNLHAVDPLEATKGDADAEAKAHGIGEGYLSNSQMADGRESNRAACEIVHRRDEHEDA